MWNPPSVVMQCLRLLPFLLWALANQAFAQAVYEGNLVQAELNAAITAGATSYTLPPGRINLVSSLRIPPGTISFTLNGQNGTRLVRNSTVDFPLILVGTHGTHAYDNAAFIGAPTSLSPVAEGSQTITRTGGQVIVPGWYGLIGVGTTDDVVRSSDGASTFSFKRELVRVVSVNGNTATLDGPVGREFANAELRFLETPSTPILDKRVCQRITLRNLVLDGASVVDGSKASKVLVLGLSSGVFVDDVSVSNFSTAGISAQVSKGVTINRARLSLGRTDTLGYGIEIGGSRFVTIRNSTFTSTKTGVLFQFGTMDGLVEDCTGTTVNFDGGHGTGEKRITYRRVLGYSFHVANSTWRRGADNVLLENVSALDSIHVHGGASNVTIRGKYATQSQTAPLIYVTTSDGGSGIPTGVSYVQSLTLEDGNSFGAASDGVALRMSNNGTTPRLGSLVIRRWNFSNPVISSGASIVLAETANSPNVTISDSSFTNLFPYSPSLWFGPVTGSNRWNLDLRRNMFITPGINIIRFLAGAKATWVNEGNTINGLPVTAANVENPSALQ